jgi:purine nucleosidase
MISPRARVIVDNDFSGDPDDLFQLVHHLLSPSVDVRFIIGSHLAVTDPFDSSATQAENAVAIAQHVVDLMGMDVPVVVGSNVGLIDTGHPIDSPAARAIVEEAMRTDTDLPLYVALGAGLTELASAYLLEPRIADRLIAVWIGGAEHDGLAESPIVNHLTGERLDEVEYNLNIDIPSAQVLFNDSTVPIWQIPRDVYRQCLVGLSELNRRVRPLGQLGDYLVGALDEVATKVAAMGWNLGETYVLGDSPLVLVTALQTAFQPDSASSFHVTIPTPFMGADGRYSPNPDGRPLRVYTRVDNRLMFEDFYNKLATFAETQV